MDGHEAQLGVNHLGHYLLTDLLMEMFVAAPTARIINVASTAHLFGSIRFDNLQSEGFFGYPALGWAAYGQSKLCNLLFTYELHRHLRRAGIDHIDVNAIHPGVVDTGALPALAVTHALAVTPAVHALDAARLPNLQCALADSSALCPPQTCRATCPSTCGGP